MRIIPENSLPLSQITRGHFPENQGFHYVVLRRDEIVSENESTMSWSEVEPELNEENESTMGLNKLEPELIEENESNKECGKFSTECLWKYWKKIFFYALTQSDNTFPAMFVALFKILLLSSHVSMPSEKKQWDSSPRLYVNDHIVFPKDNSVPGENHVNVKQQVNFRGFIVVLSWKLDVLSTIRDGTAHGMFH